MFEPAKFLLDRRANEWMIYAICSPNSSIVMDPKLDLLEPWPKSEAKWGKLIFKDLIPDLFKFSFMGHSLL